MSIFQKVLASHLGRPDGKKNKKFSLEPVAKELEKVLGKPVKFLDDCVSDQTLKAVKNPSDGSVLLLENLRFYAEETGSSKDENKKKVKADPKRFRSFVKNWRKWVKFTLTTLLVLPTERIALCWANLTR